MGACKAGSRYKDNWISQHLPEWSFCLCLAFSNLRATDTLLQQDLPYFFLTALLRYNKQYVVFKMYNLICCHMCVPMKPTPQGDQHNHPTPNLPFIITLPPLPLNPGKHPSPFWSLRSVYIF